MTQEALIGLGDEELVAAVRGLIDDVDQDAADAVHAGLDELLERVAPELHKRTVWIELADEPGRAGEMDEILAAIDSRAGFRPLARELGQLETR